MFFISLKFAFECMFLTNSFCLKRVYKALFSFKTCILQMAPGWDAWEQVDSDKCDTLSSLKWTSFITLFVSEALWSHLLLFSPLKSIPQQGSVVPPSAPQDYCGSNDTSRFSITGTIEWFKPFLVLAWASGAEYGLQCRPNSCRDDCITRCFPKGRVQCSQDRFLLKRWLCLSDSFSLFWSTFSVVPSCHFSFQLYPEVCLVWANLTKTVKIIFQLKIKRITKCNVNIVWLILFIFWLWLLFNDFTVKQTL